jgi:hypothetical protein
VEKDEGGGEERKVNEPAHISDEDTATILRDFFDNSIADLVDEINNDQLITHTVRFLLRTRGGLLVLIKEREERMSERTKQANIKRNKPRLQSLLQK